MPNLFWRNNLSFTRNCLNALKRVTVICSKVLYNAAAVYCQMGQWEQARDVLLSASQEKGPGRGGSMEAALESIRVSSFVFRFKVKDYLVRSWFSWKKRPCWKTEHVTKPSSGFMVTMVFIIVQSNGPAVRILHDKWLQKVPMESPVVGLNKTNISPNKTYNDV